jgi:transcriptional regulator with XRE-family HTH domain
MGLKSLREQRKLSQEAVADAVGISVSYLSRLETGDRNLSGKLVKEFIKFFSCDPGDLFAPNGSGELVARPVQSVTVKGQVEAGSWREALEWAEENWYPINVPRLRDTAKNAFALEVKGESMNLKYPPGS